MGTEEIKTILKKLKANNLQFKLNGNIFAAKYHLLSIFFENCNDEGKIKDILGKDLLKGTKFYKTLQWYLGDREKVLSLQFKKDVVMDVWDLERMQSDDYVNVT